ncbi:MAG TPA: hypothetical protein VGU20_20915 [Stellaceae bacterium]|nr:hypothetical protein [Stellaceae bacterium]
MKTFLRAMSIAALVALLGGCVDYGASPYSVGYSAPYPYAYPYAYGYPAYGYAAPYGYAGYPYSYGFLGAGGWWGGGFWPGGVIFERGFRDHDRFEHDHFAGGGFHGQASLPSHGQATLPFRGQASLAASGFHGGGGRAGRGNGVGRHGGW